ncbi:Hypothetical protein R9X50_00196100 [Acrodontium crateriforme]|uniref:PARG helical domain-containing protein n=1 Tax=Acrodontium crateriforme TaxID=150365 RepID=A0AAQ3R355_9PEZI|nr:Hypothetical protein R9X50_00196100 [Acrodontium crateriforme]
MATHFILPSSPNLQCEDRFSILDSDELTVPFWAVFQKLLEQKVEDSKGIIDILETIALTLRGTTDTDYGSLREYLETKRPRDFFAKTWPCLVKLALRLPFLFPSHSLPILSSLRPSVKLSREQTACLVVHQFFCTLQAPTWQSGFQDFRLWFSAEQPHASAVEAYLTALFAYFQRLVDGTQTSPLAYPFDEWNISFDLCSYNKQNGR